jgi:Zn-dependent peptidase ImmA (M78 family)
MKITDEQRREDEANQFAMELLMPVDFVRAEVAHMKGRDIGDDTTIKELAKKFQVPASIMAIRIGQLRERREL